MSKRGDEAITNTMRLLDELLSSVRQLRKVIDEEGVVRFTFTLFAPRVVEAIEEEQELGGYVAVDTKAAFTRKTSKSEDELIKRIIGDQSEERMDDQFESNDEEEDPDKNMEGTENTDPVDGQSDVQAERNSEDPDGAKQGDEGSETPEKKGETTDNRIMKKEEVRVILNRIAKAGFEQEIKNLLAKRGAKTLGQVDPKEYAALVAEAEGLTDG